LYRYADMMLIQNVRFAFVSFPVFLPKINDIVFLQSRWVISVMRWVQVDRATWWQIVNLSRVVVLSGFNWLDKHVSNANKSQLDMLLAFLSLISDISHYSHFANNTIVMFALEQHVITIFIICILSCIFRIKAAIPNYRVRLISGLYR